MNFHVDPGEVVALVGESGCGQVGQRDGRRRPAARVRRGVRIGAAARRRAARPVRPRDVARSAARPIGTVFQDPMSALTPGLHRRRPDRRGHRDPPAAAPTATGGPRPRGRTARARRHRPAGTARHGVPARTVRRRAPARRDRDRDRQRSRPADLRRADHRAGRHRAGADPRRARDRARRHRRRRADHHPRPRRGRRVRRTGHW